MSTNLERNAVRHALHSSLNDVLSDVNGPRHTESFMPSKSIRTTAAAVLQQRTGHQYQNMASFHLNNVGGNSNPSLLSLQDQQGGLTSHNMASFPASALTRLSSSGMVPNSITNGLGYSPAFPTAMQRLAAATRMASTNASSNMISNSYIGAPVGGGCYQEDSLMNMAAESRIMEQAQNALLQRRLFEHKKNEMLLEQRYLSMLRGNGAGSLYAGNMDSSYLLKNKQLMSNPTALSAFACQMTSLPASGYSTSLQQQHQQQSHYLQQQQHHQQQQQAALSQTSQSISSTAKSSALEALGNSLRQKADPYVDVSTLDDPDPDDSHLRRTRGGVSEPFPEKLHRMLVETEKEGLTDIVSFYSHGRAFGVHDTDRFVAEVMPKYFKQSKWNSFARQLNLYGFVRITSGPDAGGYYHELFLKGRPNLSFHMRRVGVPQGEDRRKFKVRSNKVDPDFYSMKPVLPAPLTQQL